ncbi:unnamed protein product [Nippostrongylus brasiliensis]|uniref:SCP domain-containing protein n=1 Tax=Nippostrongylus brasiliensis TaxID=27835 RepID=A0A0N4YFF2_NIPBR|nr:unnamed protein product [Nippostrongylus brasiliensis]
MRRRANAKQCNEGQTYNAEEQPRHTTLTMSDMVDVPKKRSNTDEGTKTKPKYRERLGFLNTQSIIRQLVDHNVKHYGCAYATDTKTLDANGKVSQALTCIYEYE